MNDLTVIAVFAGCLLATFALIPALARLRPRERELPPDTAHVRAKPLGQEACP